MEFSRRTRVKRFWRECQINETTSIIDIGGTMFFWKLARSLGLASPRRIVVVNPLIKEPRLHPTGVFMINGDARDLRNFQPGEFDVAFSNSVIEHLGSWESQEKMAREVQRVAKVYWVQTPDPRFPIEPHYLAPAMHWLPRASRHRLARWTLWGMLKNPANDEITARIEELRLVKASEMLKLFPDGRLIVERFLGWPKSLIATNAAGPAGGSSSPLMRQCRL